MCKKLFFIVPVLLLLFSASQPAKGDLVAYYPFDGNAEDASGNGLNGTEVGDPNYEHGYVGQAIRLENGQYVDCGNDPLFDITEQITLAAWFKINEHVSMGGLMTKGDSSWRVAEQRGAGGFEAAFTGLDVEGTNWGNINFGEGLDDGEWHHIAATFDGTTLSAYVDGVLAASTAASGMIDITTANVFIGGNSERAGREWNGWIDEVQIYNHALTQEEVQEIVEPGPIPIAYYPFDGNADDASGNGLHGAEVGDPNYEDGYIGQAIRLNGDGQYVDCGNDPLFDITEQITLAAWFKINEHVSMGGLVTKGDSSWRIAEQRGAGGFEAAFSGLDVEGTNWGNINFGEGLDDGEWHHIAATFDGTTLSAYLDGVLAASTAASGMIDITTANVFIGGNSERAGREWNGWIDEVKIYNQALTADEVALLAAPVPYAWYKLDEGEGNVAYDSSGNGYDGVILNGETGGLGDANSVWLDDPNFGMVASFNGDDAAGAYIDCNMIIPILGPNDSFTWAFWAKQDESQGTEGMDAWNIILGNRHGGDEDMMFIKFTPDRFEFFAGDSDANIDYDIITADMGWVHHAVVKDANNLTYYRDAAAIATSDGTGVTVGDVNPFYIGGDAQGERWAGSISDVQLFSYALTDNEVLLISGLSAPAEVPEPEPEDSSTPAGGGGFGGG